jgi:hypothetical protein
MSLAKGLRHRIVRAMPCSFFGSPNMDATYAYLLAKGIDVKKPIVIRLRHETVVSQRSRRLWHLLSVASGLAAPEPLRCSVGVARPFLSVLCRRASLTVAELGFVRHGS